MERNIHDELISKQTKKPKTVERPKRLIIDMTIDARNGKQPNHLLRKNRDKQYMQRAVWAPSTQSTSLLTYEFQRNMHQDIGRFFYQLTKYHRKLNVKFLWRTRDIRRRTPDLSRIDRVRQKLKTHLNIWSACGLRIWVKEEKKKRTKRENKWSHTCSTVVSDPWRNPSISCMTVKLASDKKQKYTQLLLIKYFISSVQCVQM